MNKTSHAKIEGIFLHDTQMAQLYSLRQWYCATCFPDTVPDRTMTYVPFQLLPLFCPLACTVDYTQTQGTPLCIGEPRISSGWLILPVIHSALSQEKWGQSFHLQSFSRQLGITPLPDIPCFLLGFAGDISVIPENEGQSFLPAGSVPLTAHSWYHARLDITLHHEANRFISAQWTQSGTHWHKG